MKKGSFTSRVVNGKEKRVRPVNVTIRKQKRFGREEKGIPPILAARQTIVGAELDFQETIR
ncbi:MAG: hypothetical protein HY764_04235 [Candidatus Portnoybacteria bacterium]|nr:hypothetical protein [Candidatus Portnoybacteria bacterium]